MAERNKNAAAVALGGLGWLKGKSVARGGRQARRDYRLTTKRQKVLKLMREQTRSSTRRLSKVSGREAKCECA
jgi:DNA-binding PadR family transcriptional regulator